MKKIIAGLLLLGLCTSLMAAVSLHSANDKLSYTVANDLGQNFKTQGIKVNEAAFQQGFHDGLRGKSQLSRSEKQAVVRAYQQQMMQKIQQKMAKEGAANAKAGAVFLAANAKKPGVKVTASGLQYKVLKSGKGARPKADSTVTVDYKGELLDGNVFDSSYKRGQPATFSLQQVIKGWTEGLQLMRVGAKYQFFIPAKLAYGSRGIPGTIPPDSTLIFTVELKHIKSS